jgi:pilus assembly protein Flp/PilA
MSLFRKLLRDERGAAAVELGLILGLMVVAMFGALSGLGNEVNNSFSTTAQKYSEAAR